MKTFSQPSACLFADRAAIRTHTCPGTRSMQAAFEWKTPCSPLRTVPPTRSRLARCRPVPLTTGAASRPFHSITARAITTVCCNWAREMDLRTGMCGM